MTSTQEQDYHSTLARNKQLGADGPSVTKTYTIKHEQVRGGSSRNPVYIPFWVVYELDTTNVENDGAVVICYTVSQQQAVSIASKLSNCTNSTTASTGV